MQNNNIKSNFFKGVRQALPIVLGYIPIGLSFGILAADTLRHTGIFLMSLLVYAGSAQFISVSMLAGQASAISVIVTVFLVNLRHLLFSASLSPYARAIPARLLALISFEMTDESFAVEIQEARKKQSAGSLLFRAPSYRACKLDRGNRCRRDAGGVNSGSCKMGHRLCPPGDVHSPADSPGKEKKRHGGRAGRRYYFRFPGA